jgi:hypothetical protein
MSDRMIAFLLTIAFFTSLILWALALYVLERFLKRSPHGSEVPAGEDSRANPLIDSIPSDKSSNNRSDGFH